MGSYRGDGLGYYDFMAYGYKGFDLQQAMPSQLSAWSKVKMGWATPEVINAATINESGTYTVRAGENHVLEIGKGMFIDQATDKDKSNGLEYFLVENRQP